MRVVSSAVMVSTVLCKSSSLARKSAVNPARLSFKPVTAVTADLNSAICFFTLPSILFEKLVAFYAVRIIFCGFQRFFQIFLSPDSAQRQQFSIGRPDKIRFMQQTGRLIAGLSLVRSVAACFA